LSPISVISDRT
jgi:hypothetical protein